MVFRLFSIYLEWVYYGDKLCFSVDLPNTSQKHSKPCLNPIACTSMPTCLIFQIYFSLQTLAVNSLFKGSDSVATPYPNWHNKDLCKINTGERYMSWFKDAVQVIKCHWGLWIHINISNFHEVRSRLLVNHLLLKGIVFVEAILFSQNITFNPPPCKIKAQF